MGTREDHILLCFDYGNKRIGVAVGQTVTASATALQTVKVKRGQPDWVLIDRLMAAWNPNKLIVGHPLTLERKRQVMTSAAEQFGKQLEGRFQISVDMVEEQLSSFSARRELKSTRGLDPVAARLILETWFQENNY